MPVHYLSIDELVQLIEIYLCLFKGLNTNQTMSLDQEVEILQNLLKLVKVGDIPRRSSVGTLGKRIALVSNLYGVSTSLSEIFHYDVTIVALDGNVDLKYKRPIPVKVNRRVIQELARSVHLDGRLPAFDGRTNLYLAHRLPSDRVTAEVAITIDPDATEDEFSRKSRFEVTDYYYVTLNYSGVDCNGANICLSHG